MRLLLIFLSAALACYVLAAIPKLESANGSFFAASVAWVVSVLLYLAAMWDPTAVPRIPSSQRRRTLLLLITGIVLLAAVLRMWDLGSVPFTLAGDEASQGLQVVRVIEGESRNPFKTAWLGVPTLSFFYNAWSVMILGANITGLRLAWSLAGVLSVWAAYLAIARISGRIAGLTTAGLVATYHYHLHYSRLGSNQIADALFVSATFWLLYRGMDTDRPLDWALAGICAGMGMYGYAGARLAVIAGGLALAFITLRLPRATSTLPWRGALIAAGGFFFAAAPILQYALRYPAEFHSRVNQVGIFQNGWLSNEVRNTGRTAASLLLDQFERAALAFNVFPDRVVWYGLPEPLLDPVFGVLFLLGLGLSLLNLFGNARAARSAAPMVIWWVSGITLGGALTESPPSSQRLVSLSVPVCYFIAVALIHLGKLTTRAVSRIRPAVIVSAGGIVFAVISLHTYFVSYTPTRTYGGNHAELATMLAPELRRLPKDFRVYFAGPPEMYWEFATIHFLAPGTPGRDIEPPLTHENLTSIVGLGHGKLFVFLPTRSDEIEVVRQGFPGGVLQKIHSPGDGQLLGTLYYVDAARPATLQ